MAIKSPKHEVYIKSAGPGRHFDMDTWCTEKFGKRWSVIDNREGKWSCFWAGRKKPGYYLWAFQDEQDAVIFKLKWS